jgi:hypothetical protein
MGAQRRRAIARRDAGAAPLMIAATTSFAPSSETIHAGELAQIQRVRERLPRRSRHARVQHLSAGRSAPRPAAARVRLEIDGTSSFEVDVTPRDRRAEEQDPHHVGRGMAIDGPSRRPHSGRALAREVRRTR